MNYILKDPITIILVLTFFTPIILGFISIKSTRDLKYELLEIQKNICFLVALIVSIVLSRKLLFTKDLTFLTKHLQPYIDTFLNEHTFISFAIVLFIITSIIYMILCLIIHLFNAITIDPLLRKIYNFGQRKNNIVKRILGSIIQIPKSIVYVVLCTIILNFGTMIYSGDKLNDYLQKSYLYDYICNKVVVPMYNSSFAKKIPIIVNNTLNVEKSNDRLNDKSNDNSNGKKIIYYNGITAEEGIKSNNKLNSFAKNLTSNVNNDIKKAKILYDWIGSNINYDYEKAQQIMNSNYENQSGAISTFNSKTGICFDYACLYTAMAKASGLKSRMISGKGFNGTSWVNHAWNQVYIKESNEWINLDCTFSKSGNYFNTQKFHLDHKNDEIIGEW